MAPAPTRHRSVSPAVEDYLKAIYALEDAGGGPVATAELADRLQVSRPSVSGMLRKLDDLGFLDYAPYQGVRLSTAGRHAALMVVRRHRLLELFLSQTLDLTWDKVHDEAELLEHALSPGLCDLIAARLGEPALDPHGDPIPNRDGEVDDPAHEPLASIEDGAAVRIARVSDRDPDVLRWLSSNGLGLGQVIAVVARDEAGDLTVTAAGGRVGMPERVVEAVLVDRTV